MFQVTSTWVTCTFSLRAPFINPVSRSNSLQLLKTSFSPQQRCQCLTLPGLSISAFAVEYFGLLRGVLIHGGPTRAWPPNLSSRESRVLLLLVLGMVTYWILQADCSVTRHEFLHLFSWLSPCFALNRSLQTSPRLGFGAQMHLKRASSRMKHDFKHGRGAEISKPGNNVRREASLVTGL